MSEQHPIIAVTGACGAGTTSVQQAFKEIFYRQGINSAYIEGDGFLRFTDEETDQRVLKALAEGRSMSCYGPDLNDFSKLETCFRQYSEHGTGEVRFKINETNHHLYDAELGGFTEWQDIPSNTDCLFYEGMHGGVVADTWTRRKPENSQRVLKERRSRGSHGVNVAQYVDLLIGVAPAINLEWIQRIHGDRMKRLHSPQEVTKNILLQLQDYIHFIVPQFSITDINFQRVPVVDTSNPFDMQVIPADDESIIVVSFRKPEEHDLLSYASRIEGAVLTRRCSLIISGGQLLHALDIICAPLLEKLIESNSRG